MVAKMCRTWRTLVALHLHHLSPLCCGYQARCLSCFGVSQLFLRGFAEVVYEILLGAVEQEKMCTSRVSSRTRFLVLAHQIPYY